MLLMIQVFWDMTYVTGWVVNDVSEGRNTFIFGGQQVQKNSLTLEDEGTAFLRNVENHPLSDTATHCSRTESSIKFNSIY